MAQAVVQNLLDQYQRDAERVNPDEYVGVIVFVANDPEMLYFSFWDLRKERELSRQFLQQGLNVALFLDAEDRLKKYDIIWRHKSKDEPALPTHVFARWQVGKCYAIPVVVHVPGVQIKILYF